MDTLKLRGLELLTTRQAAEVVGVSQRRMQQICADGKLGIIIGGSYMIARSELDKYLETEHRPGRPPKKEDDHESASG